MSKADEYRVFAGECIQSARVAVSEDARKQFMDLAKMWMTAAQQSEDGMRVPLAPGPDQQPKH